jgi:hypothetical protein
VVSSSSYFHYLCRVLNLFSGITDVTYVHTVTTYVSQSQHNDVFILLSINYV